MQQILHALAYTATSYFLLTWFGVLCRLIFNLTGLKDATASDDEPAHNAGRWYAQTDHPSDRGRLAALGDPRRRHRAQNRVAFKDLDKRNFAEYFLVGSLFSILWAMLVAGAWQAYDHSIGVDMRHRVIVLFGVDEVEPKTG